MCIASKYSSPKPKYNNLNNILNLLQNINTPLGNDDQTELHKLVITDDQAKIELALNSNIICNFNIEDNFGKTPMYYAIESENFDIINLLTTRQPGIQVKINEIFEEYLKTNPKLIQDLFINCPHIKYTINEYKSFSALYLAIYLEQNEIVEFILKSSLEISSHKETFDINQAYKVRDIKELENNFTPSGIKIDIGSNELTPFEFAFRMNNLDLMKMVIYSANFDFNKVYSGLATSALEYTTHNTLIHYLASSSDYKNLITDILRAKNVDINAKNSEGHTPLMVSIRSFNNDISEILLLKEEVNLKAVDAQGNTALHYLLLINDEIDYEEYKQFLETFLKKDIDINAQNNLGNTPLHQIMISYDDCYGADSMFEDDEEMEVTFKDELIRIIKILLEHNIDSTIKNNEGKTALELAKNYNWQEAVDLFSPEHDGVEEQFSANDNVEESTIFSNIEQTSDTEVIGWFNDFFSDNE